MTPFTWRETQGTNKKTQYFGFALASLLFGLCSSGEAQQQIRIPRIGYLTGTIAPTIAAPDLNADSFRRGLRDLGYIEGKNIQIEYRYGAVNSDPCKPCDRTVTTQG